MTSALLSKAAIFKAGAHMCQLAVGPMALCSSVASGSQHRTLRWPMHIVPARQP